MIIAKVVVKNTMEVETGHGPVVIPADGQFHEVGFDDRNMLNFAKEFSRENLTVISEEELPVMEIQAEPAHLNIKEEAPVADEPPVIDKSENEPKVPSYEDAPAVEAAPVEPPAESGQLGAAAQEPGVDDELKSAKKPKKDKKNK